MFSSAISAGNIFVHSVGTRKDKLQIFSNLFSIPSIESVRIDLCLLCKLTMNTIYHCLFYSKSVKAVPS